MATRPADFDYAPPPARPALSLVRAAPAPVPARYGARRGPNWPVIGCVAAAHVLVGALLLATGTVHLKSADKPVIVRMIPEAVKPSPPPPQPDIPLEQIRPEVFVPDVLVETQAAKPSPLVVTDVPPPPKAAMPPSVAVPNPGPPVAAPVSPPDFQADQLNNPGPRYPAMSRRNHEQGTATLRVLVSAEGRAQDLTVATTSGFKRLDDAALQAVRNWKFVPAKQAGHAVTAYVLVPVTFALS